MEQANWFERKFDFSYEQNIFPSLIERLSGTVLRLEDKFAKIPVWKHRKKSDKEWSMLEQLGHLVDLEPLWQTRLNEILEGKEQLTPADLNNTKTNEANHNQRTYKEILADFASLREQTLKMMRNLDEDDLYKSAIHPRLQSPMRVMDLFLFAAEHDDHHLAKLSELDRRFE